MDKFKELLDKIVQENLLVKATLSQVKKSDYRKIEVNPFLNKENKIVYQLSKYTKDKVYHQNLSDENFKVELIKLMR